VVALDRRDAHEPVVDHDGGVDVVVGQVTAAVVGVVADEHVALAPFLRGEEVQGEAHRQRGGEHELRDADRQRGEPPRESRTVALRSLDWLRIGVVAVRLT
jgi:hypothetical protein